MVNMVRLEHVQRWNVFGYATCMNHFHYMLVRVYIKVINMPTYKCQSRIAGMDPK